MRFFSFQLLKSWWVFTLLTLLGGGASYVAATFFLVPEPQASYQGKVEGRLVTEEEVTHAELDLRRGGSFTSRSTLFVPADPRSASRSSVLRELATRDSFYESIGLSLDMNTQAVREGLRVSAAGSADFLTIEAWGRSARESEDLRAMGIETLETLDDYFFPDAQYDVVSFGEHASPPVLKVASREEERQSQIFSLIVDRRASRLIANLTQRADENSALTTAISGYFGTLLPRKVESPSGSLAAVKPPDFSVSREGVVVGLVRHHDEDVAQVLVQNLRSAFIAAPTISTVRDEFQTKILFFRAEEPVLVGQPETVSPAAVTAANGALFGFLAAFALVSLKISREARFIRTSTARK